MLLGRLGKFVCTVLVCSVCGTGVVYAEHASPSNAIEVRSAAREDDSSVRKCDGSGKSVDERSSDSDANTKKWSLENFVSKKAIVVTSVAPAACSTVNIAFNVGREIYNYVKEKNAAVRDYISIGLQRQDGSLNDRGDVIASFSKALAERGFTGFTVVDSTGHWFDPESNKEFKEPSLIFFVDGKKSQSKEIDGVAQKWLAESEFDQSCVEHVTTRIGDGGGFVYKDGKESF